MRTETGSWICCQLGAREHYAAARALQRQQRLAHLITDAWVRPGSLLHALPGEGTRRLRERYHEELADAPVIDFSWSLIARQMQWTLSNLRGWDLFIARNNWFQRRAAAALDRIGSVSGAPTVLAHSYAAREIFRAAKARGWVCVLAQIDAGERHFEIVQQLATAAPEFGPPPLPPPAAYFENWRDECELADYIIVNSEWSRACLAEARVETSKLRLAPLAYEANAAASAPHRYPARFTAERPLQLLFVGSVSVAKGIKALLDAMQLLVDAPVRLTIVGERAATMPAVFTSDPRIDWVGAVSRSDVMHHYRTADVLVFPSHSDGFGMAQVEAQGWKLPVVASRSCGRVVQDGVNGLLLPEVSGPAIAAAIRKLIDTPVLLDEFSRASGTDATHGLDALGRALGALDAA